MSASRSITTRKGDRGTTYLLSGEEVQKDSARTMAYGDLDELVSVLGIARCHVENEEIRREILELQRDLFSAGAELATSPEKVPHLKQRIEEADLAKFDAQREKWEQRVKMPDGFIIPGGVDSLGAAHLDHARTVARRVERRVVRLVRENLVENDVLLRWFNRFSDYLWLIARIEEGESLSLRELRNRKDGV